MTPVSTTAPQTDSLSSPPPPLDLESAIRERSVQLREENNNNNNSHSDGDDDEEEETQRAPMIEGTPVQEVQSGSQHLEAALLVTLTSALEELSLGEPSLVREPPGSVPLALGKRRRCDEDISYFLQAPAKVFCPYDRTRESDAPQTYEMLESDLLSNYLHSPPFATVEEEAEEPIERRGQEDEDEDEGKNDEGEGEHTFSGHKIEFD